MSIRSAAVILAVFLFAAASAAQTAEVTVTVNEQFFDSFLDAMYQNGVVPEVPLAKNQITDDPQDAAPVGFERAAFSERKFCNESIKILRENQSVRTAVRFRDGQILMPLAFSGTYNPPLIGCVEFGGYAESNITLEFDPNEKRLIGRVHVSSVVLNGTAGIGSGVVTRLVQSSIDKKLNPLEIIRTDKLSFTLPVQNSSVRMEATGIRTEVGNASLLIHIDYAFPK